MNNKPVFFDKNAEMEITPLRQPKFIPQNIVVETTKPPTTTDPQVSRLKEMEEILAKSALKADAPEWYPKNITNNHVDSLSHSVQDRLKIHKYGRLSQASNNIAAVPIQNVSHVPVENIHNTPTRVGTNGEDPDIKRLKQIVTTLTKDPGQFDNLVELFMETLCPHLDEIMFLSSFTKLLVDQAIANPNFRYTCARLCLFIELNSPKFRAELHLMCKKKLDNNAVTQNFLLFIAELYTQLQHLEVYGTLLIECFKELLNKGGDDNIKCICQALKLTGYYLERKNTNDLNDVFVQLNSIKAKLNGSPLILLNSVLALRQANWGYPTEESTDSEHDIDEYAYDAPDQPIFYQQDGNVLTNEESDFIAAHEEYLSDVSNPDDLCDPEPEMDAEIQEAFKEFVKFSNKP